MKKIALIISAVFILAFLFGCGTEKAEPLEQDMNNANETEIELATKEDIMEYFDFSDEDLEGIDVDGVIKLNQLKKESLNDFFTSRESCLEYFQRYDEKIKTDVSYLFKGGQPDGEIPVSQIKTVALMEYEGIVKYYWNIRIQDKKAYYCSFYTENIDLENECSYSKELTEDYINELLNCPEIANLHKWQAAYKGKDDESTELCGWELGIELIDGTVYSWSGWGEVYSDHEPEEYKSIAKVIIKSTK